METSVKLSPCPSSVKALALSSLYRKVIAPMNVDVPTVVEFVAKTWKKPVSIVAMVDDVKTSNVFKFGFDNANDRGLVGNVIKLDLEEDKPASWTTFFKVQVDIDIHRPLFSGCFFDLNSGVKQWLQVKFEKIGIFCYNCGRLGHQRCGCSLSSPVTVAKCDGIPFSMYGPWLSTSSTYHDVFSGPVYGGSSNFSSLAVVKNGGAHRPLLASPTPVAGGSKGFSGIVHRPRRPVMVTHRVAAKPGEVQRLEWHPKQSDAGYENSFAVLGNGGDKGVLLQGKASEGIASLGRLSVEGGKLKNLNSSNNVLTCLWMVGRLRVGQI
ncbi:hypothetical protein F8388_004596 [Cannabis sativa]|uniref:CCHC-type domain-containing protein n=1 Tax=Cannabis sativa TaxID=3483 RepID=A0A7J6GN78_CANSA|nr:hypothetical protein F8388_004596 [Cannabis sativa]